MTAGDEQLSLGMELAPQAPPGRHAAPVPQQGWPCLRCGALVDFELSSCSSCGGKFLAGVAAENQLSVTLPGVGDVTRLGRGARLGLAGVAMLLGTAALLLLFTVGGLLV
jgi:hypothetical protein